MKKILIVSQAMEIGGAEKALLGLLENIDTSEYDVDLFLMQHSGELLESIPPDINLLPEIKQYKMLGIPIKSVLKQKEILLFLGRIIGKIKAKRFCQIENIVDTKAVEDLYSHKYTVKYMPNISSQEYDVAISFLAPHYIVQQKVSARKKIAWIHTDYETIDIDVQSELDMWRHYENIVSISDHVTSSFLKIFPDLKNRIKVIQNIIPVKYMEQLVQRDNVDQEMPSGEAIKLLSVGRFCTAKNFDNVPEICKIIRDKGLNVIWYLIGYGQDEELIKRKIAEFEMEKYVIILGKKENPYPYFKQCDIYIQPSRYEGKCVSVIEAQMMHKPVVITNYATSSSQLENSIDGVIVPMDNRECGDAIASILRNRSLLKHLSECCSRRDYANTEEINKVYTLLQS